MAEKFQLHVSKSDIEPLLNKQITIDRFLTKLFKESNAHGQMCNALKEYHRNDGGSPEVHDFEIINVSFDNQCLKGRFRCKFAVIYHYTCSDVRNQSFDTIDWDLQVDENNAVLFFSGEEILTRDME